ncbi:MAG: RdgB/HAM1 family non-canonical purine NTP pyrophosphatase [Chthoniobacterales bacterium]
MSDHVVRLRLATRNAHKAREFRELLGPEFALEDLVAHPEIGEVIENGATFEANARIKAVAISRQLPGLVLADDSGLEVDSLGGAPGIFSARYAGQGASDAQHRRKLLDALTELPPDSPRTARFRCLLALARGGRVIATFTGTVEGKIARAERGSGGFGYDSLFLPNESATTFAELSAAEKNVLSHRAAAVVQLRDFLRLSTPGISYQG